MSDNLAHFGIKGMRWGQRKAAKQQAKQRQVTLNTTRGIRRATVLSKIAGKHPVDVFMGQLKDGVVDFKILEHPTMSPEQRTSFRSALETSMLRVEQSLERDGLKD